MYFCNMFSKGIYLITILSVFIFACEESSQTTIKEDGTFDIVIEQKAGDDYSYESGEDTKFYMNYPFHFGYVRGFNSETVKCIVLSKSASARNRITAKPIGLIKTLEQGSKISYIIAIPSDVDQRNLELDNFSDLATKYSSVKNIIEFWLLNRCGLGCVKNEGWGNEKAAEFVLEKLKET